MSTTFIKPELETLGAIAESLKGRATQLAVDLSALAALAKELGQREVLTAIETNRMADAWTKVTRSLYAELSVVEKQVGNAMQRARMQTAIAALDQADWFRDFASVAGQEGKQLASLAKNAGSLITALDLFINVATPDKTSFEVGSSASGALIGMGVVAMGVAFGLPALAIGAVAIGGTLLGKALFENFAAPALGLSAENGPLFRDSASQSLEILLKGASSDTVRITDEEYLLDVLRKVVLGSVTATPRNNPEAYFQNSYC
jgi:hypothetical protein